MYDLYVISNMCSLQIHTNMDCILSKYRLVTDARDGERGVGWGRVQRSHQFYLQYL